MKTIVLMRHAHPEYGYDTNDVERRLTSEGRAAAARSAQYLLQNGFVPSVVFTSHAQRAKQTTSVVVQTLNLDPSCVSVHEFIYYGYTTDELLELIKTASDDADTLMIVGHNPDISTATGNLVSQHGISFPPSAVVVVGFDVDSWQQIEARLGVVISYYAPKL
jgi:phosphohistidine phosphatase